MTVVSEVRRNANGGIEIATIAASPIGSSLTFAHEFMESVRVTFEQKPYPGVERNWKPNEIVLDGISAVRALRDICNEFLDRFHDEAE